MRRVYFSAIALVIIMGSSIYNPKAKTPNAENTECAIVEVDKEKTICKKEPKGEIVEVLYFHGAERCDTCITIEKLTRQVVNQKFAKELKDGKLQISIINLSTSEGEQIAHRYKAEKSSLFVNKWIGGKESVDNLTQLGFSMAQSHPEKFKVQIEAKLALLLR